MPSTKAASRIPSPKSLILAAASYLDSNAPGEETVAECVGRFANIAVARTRILLGSSVRIADLPKGEHLFQCCIHPWMRVKVEVK